MKSDNLSAHKSELYDSQIRNTIPYYNCFHEEVINLIKASKIEPKIWLDTGCGTANLVKKTLGIFSDTLFLLVDPSEEMIDEAKKKLRDVETNKVRFLESAPTQEISLEVYEKPDVITAIQSHHYLSEGDRRKATKVCYDALNLNGIYITFENICPFSDKGIDIGKENWSNFQMSNGKDIEVTNSHIKRFGVEYFPITVEEHLKLLRECGFKVVELLWYSYMQAGFYCIK